MRSAISLIAAAWLLAGSPALLADVYVLDNGGRVSGELLNPDESPRQKFVIKTPAGQVTLQRSQVKQIVPVRSVEAEYQRIRPGYPDTVEGQWELAQWCLQQRLSSQREVHLRRIIELDPNHAEARRALGYSLFSNKWMTHTEFNEANGFRRYKGVWRSQQEIELLENKRSSDISEKDWFQKVNRWRGWLGSDKADQGRQNLQAIDDPRAVKALAKALDDERRQPVRLLLIEILGRIGTREALNKLVDCSLSDPVEEMRLSCLDQIKGKKNPDLVARYVAELRNYKDNTAINRAALALGQLKDPSAIGPLIDALVTAHKFKVSSGGGPGSISTTFGTGGSGSPGGLAVGGGPKFVIKQMANQPVLDALIALTGVNFNFEKQLWRDWYASQKKRDTIDARRD